MRHARRLVLVVLLTLGLGLAASPAAAGEGRTVLSKDQLLARGMARTSLRGHALRHGKAYLRDNGEMAMTLAYSRGGRYPDFSFDVRWRERARGGAKPAHDINPGGRDDLYWHPLKQVRVIYKVHGAQPSIDLDAAHALARTVADQIADGARPWTSPYPDLALRRETRVHRGFSLTSAKHLNMSKNSKVTDLNYRTATTTVRVGNQAKHLSRAYAISVRWYPSGHRPTAREESYWAFEPTPQDADQHERVVTRVRSRSHYIKAELRGSHYGRDGYKDRFRDRKDWETGMARLQALMARFERFLAQPRDTTAPGGNSGSPLVADRPDSQAKTSQGSGTITSVGGRLMVMRGGRRVNLQSGGRVQLGDVLITGQGTVVIRFDNPGAGTDGSLTIAPRSKVTIDVGPYRPKMKAKPTRFRLHEGAVRFARPHAHRNPRIELATPGDVAIFGLTGTDASLVRAPFGDVFALRDGLADLKLPGARSTVITPITSLLVDKHGLIKNMRTIDAAMYSKTSERIGLGR